ncbi:MAG TPA: VTT domain-containing protein [Nocardioidaceae bacterium]|nr:VTT domain-containing protein [Nocardioidaceae bacterium]
MTACPHGYWVAVEGVLESFIGSPWAYVVVAASITGSALLSPLPSETMMVSAMSLAIAGRMNIAIVVVAAALGSWFGDVLAYHVGRLLSGHTRTWATSSKKRRAALDWVEQRQDSWGPALIMSGRFVPGGVTAVGLSAGIVRFPLRTFLAFAAVGAVVWAAYGLGIAYIGGALFPGNAWASAVMGIVIALAVSLGVHLVGRHRRRRAA